jgi:hypothetical protein
MEALRRRCHLWPREVKVVVVAAMWVVTVGFILKHNYSEFDNGLDHKNINECFS